MQQKIKMKISEIKRKYFTTEKADFAISLDCPPISRACPPMRRGFSLIETLVAVFVFSLVVTLISGALSSFLKNYADVKKSQRYLEDAQYAMNILAKTLRSSSLVGGNTTTFPLDVFDYSQATSNCIRYSYDGTNKKIQVKAFTAADLASCTTAALTANAATPTDFINNVAQAPAISAIASLPPVFGKITLALKIQATGDGSSVPIQMSVSLRQ